MVRATVVKKLLHRTGRPLVFSFTAEKGTITLITGPSGAGKTTLLKTMAGLVKPESGWIEVSKKLWFDAENRINLSVQKRRAGFVFQDYALFPNMTVREHLTFANTDDIWANELIAIGGLKANMNHYPRHLSGGQQQRLAILRAMSTKPELLLMDEPFSALDGENKITLIAGLTTLWAEMQTTVIIVSHYPHELAAICDQTIQISG